MGISWYELLYIKYTNNKHILYSTGNYTQYLVVIYDEKESENMYVWIPLLYTRNEHNTENQLHFSKKLFFTWEHLDERETIHNTDHPTDIRADVKAIRDHVGILSLLLYDLPEAVYSDKKGRLWFRPLLCCWGFKIGP